MQTTGDTWYREPWPWLLMIMPALALISGFTTLWLALSSNHSLVVDDYYRAGRAINLQIARDDAARRHRVEAMITMGAERAAVRLAAGDGTPLPDSIELALFHPTRGELDRRIRLQAAGGGLYVASMDTGLPSAVHWRVQIEGGDWRLVGEARDWHQPLRLGAGQ